MMQVEEAKFVKKKVKTLGIDVHPTEKALLVNYELEATILGELGDPMLGDKKEYQKIIRLSSLSEATNVAQLAREVISRSQLIHPSRQPEVEQLIFFLQRRRRTSAAARTSRPAAAGVVGDSGGLVCAGDGRPDDQCSPELSMSASLADADSYVELLYEEMADKERGSLLLLQLARNPDNLQELCQNEALLEALSRTLREEWRKSTALATNIVYIFFCMSTFSQFHNVVIKYKVGSLSMEILELELRRHQQWQQELGRLTRVTDDELAEASSRLQLLVAKQDQLLRVCVYLLLNLSEDVKTEEKMRKKGVLGLLVRCLQRSSPDLLLLVLTFLKKLSIYRENKDDMVALCVAEKVAPLLEHKQDDVVDVAVRLLFNLSFDATHRTQMITAELLPKLVQLIPSAGHRAAAVALLYHLSMDEASKPAFFNTDCVPVCLHLLISWPDHQVGLEVVSLCVNLMTDRRLAELACDAVGLQPLLQRALQHADPLLMKLVRNISQHDSTTCRNAFLEFVGELTESVMPSKSDEFVVELVGVLGNLSIPNLDFERLFKQYRLVDWIKSRLTAGSCEDDLLLEIVILLGTACADESCASLLVSSGLLQMLVTMLNDKQEDDEIVLQIIYAFQQITIHPTTREELINNTDAPAYLVDLLHDKNPQIRRICDSTLDTIATYSEEWAGKIRVERFRWHNAQWLEMVEAGQLDEDLSSASLENNNNDIVPHIHEREELYMSDTSSEALLDDERSMTRVRFDIND